MREVFEVVRQRADVEALDGQAQIAPVQLRLDDREAVVGILGGSAAGGLDRGCGAPRARARSQPRLSPSCEQLRGIEVDARRDGVGQEVAERDLRGDPFGRRDAARRTSRRSGSASICCVEPVGELVDQQRALARGHRALLAARPCR